MSLVEAAAKVALGRAINKLKAQLPSEKTINVFREIIDEVALEADTAVRRLIDRCDGDPQKAAERMANSVTEEEAAALFGRLLPEAAYSATQERRRLMAEAIAGVLHPDFSVEAKSRLACAISTLEPSDVILLRKLAGGQEQDAFRRPGPHQTSLDALLAAQCVVGVGAFYGGFQQKQVTTFGHELLKYVAGWTLETPG